MRLRRTVGVSFFVQNFKQRGRVAVSEYLITIVFSHCDVCKMPFSAQSDLLKIVREVLERAREDGHESISELLSDL